jgi:hypothetical protein
MAKDKKTSSGRITAKIAMGDMWSPPPPPKLDHEKVEAIKTLTSDKSLERYIPSDLKNLVAAFEDGMSCKKSKDSDEAKGKKGKK